MATEVPFKSAALSPSHPSTKSYHQRELKHVPAASRPAVWTPIPTGQEKSIEKLWQSPYPTFQLATLICCHEFCHGTHFQCPTRGKDGPCTCQQQQPPTSTTWSGVGSAAHGAEAGAAQALHGVFAARGCRGL